MKNPARIALLSCTVLASCYGGGHKHYHDPAPLTTAWDSRFEGIALDDRDRPAGEFASSVLIRLTPRGGTKYAVDFSGVLPFLLYDPYFGLPLGWYELDLSVFDRALGDFIPNPGIGQGGTYTLWTGVRLEIFELGTTDVDLILHLRTNGPTPETSDLADLSWEAGMWTSGTIFEPPATAYSNGFATVAIRVD